MQSGGGPPTPTIEESRAIAKLMMADLGLQPNDIAGLQKTEWPRLMAASRAAAAKMTLRFDPNMPPAPGAKPSVLWGPTVDGRIVTMNSLIDSSPEVSKDVPLMVGSVSEEGMLMRLKPTEAEWLATLAKSHGEAKATALIAAMKKAHPEKSIITLSYGVQGLNWRNSVLRIVKLKHALKAAPVFAYYFTWQSPMLENAGAWHTADLQFCFDNTKRCEQGTGNTPEAQALAKKMATAWSNFAHTGNPSQPGLTWEPADPDRFQNMVFDNECRMVDDPDGEARKILAG
jgi:para-nitrobenzyl esterase